MSSKPIYQGRVFRVDLDQVTLPNGVETELALIRHPGASAIVPFVSKSEVLLIRQYRYATDGMILEIPAGTLENESPETCAARELEEETGQRAGRLELLASIWTTPGFTDEKIHLFAAFDLEPSITNLDHDELIETVRMSLADAVARVYSGEICDAKSALGLLHAAKRFGAP